MVYLNSEFGNDELGTLTIADQDGTRVHHFYTCAHCSNSIIIEPTRSRPRVKCSRCNRVICEKKQICRAACTPLNELADDGFESPAKWQKYVNAIMHGVDNVDDGRRNGLILPFEGVEV